MFYREYTDLVETLRLSQIHVYLIPLMIYIRISTQPMSVYPIMSVCYVRQS